MPGLDQSLTFHPLRIAVLTISDTRDESTDRSGALLVERLSGAGHQLSDGIYPNPTESSSRKMRCPLGAETTLSCGIADQYGLIAQVWDFR